MRHLGLGARHEPYRTQQEVDTEIRPNDGNDDDGEEMDDDDLQVSVDVDDSDNESEGEEELASGSNGDSEDSSDNLGYASFYSAAANIRISQCSTYSALTCPTQTLSSISPWQSDLPPTLSIL